MWIGLNALYCILTSVTPLGAREVEVFLTHLAVQGKVAAATQNQAKAALLFLYREVLEQDLPWLQNVEQAKAPKRLPVVLTQDEVQAVLSRLSGTHWLGGFALWIGAQNHGSTSTEGQGCGIYAGRDFGSRGKRI
jgi:integrase